MSATSIVDGKLLIHINNQWVDAVEHMKGAIHKAAILAKGEGAATFFDELGFLIAPATTKIEEAADSTELAPCEQCKHGETFNDDRDVFCQKGYERGSKECLVANSLLKENNSTKATTCPKCQCDDIKHESFLINKCRGCLHEWQDKQ